MMELEQQLISLGATDLVAMFPSSNAQAFSFFQLAGYEIAGIERLGLPTLMMRKRLGEIKLGAIKLPLKKSAKVAPEAATKG